MRAGSSPAATSPSSSSIFSSTESEFASELVPKTARPTFWDRSQRQCRANRCASGARSAPNGVTTGESTPVMRVTFFPPVSGDGDDAALEIVAQRLADRDRGSGGARVPELPGQADHEQDEQSEVEDLEDPRVRAR